MIDLSKVRNYYVACGYTDLRRGIDGLSAIVTQQYAGQLSEESLFCSVDAGQTGSRRFIGLEMDISYCTNDYPMSNSNGHGLNRSFGS